MVHLNALFVFFSVFWFVCLFVCFFRIKLKLMRYGSILHRLARRTDANLT